MITNPIILYRGGAETVTLTVTGEGFFLILPTQDQQVTSTGSYQVPSGSLIVWGSTYFWGSVDASVTGDYTIIRGELYTSINDPDQRPNTMVCAFRVDSDCTINTAIF